MKKAEKPKVNKRLLVVSALSAGLFLLPGCSQRAQPAGGSPAAGSATQTVAESRAPDPAEGAQKQTEASPQASSSEESSEEQDPAEEASAEGEEAEVAQASQGEADPYFGLQPLEGRDAPELSEKKTVKMTTDLGELTIEVYPQAAPNAAERFLELVEAGFYDETPVFRVVNEPQPFVAQFGINWRGDFPSYKEKDNFFQDDPSLFRLERGTLAFAKAGPDTNSTQIFINYQDNSRLADQGNFTTFAKVVEGMELADKFRSAGSPSMGLSQEKLWSPEGGDYLEGLKEKPTMILKAEVVQ